MMTINRATVVRGPTQPDKVLLWTDLPSSMPALTLQPLMLEFNAPAGQGIAYVRAHFPAVFDINLIDTRP